MDLYDQNQKLRHKLDEFVAEARHNEQKLRRFQTLELRLIGLDSLLELVQAILNPDYSTFHWDVVTLLLVDPDHEVRRILIESGMNLDQQPHLIFTRRWEALSTFQPYSLFPMLGPYKASQHAALFPTTRRPTSVALLPLVRYGKLIGSLNIGSLNGERFVRGVRTDILEHFAAVIAICLENSTNLEHLKRQGLTDTLTAINNRRFFDQRLIEEMASSQRSLAPLSCMLLDVDHFKVVNDTYGHPVGDQVLREIAAIIRSQLRGVDVLSRYGGEEFAALLAQTPGEVATEIAERVRRSVAEHRFTLADGSCFGVTLSIGVTTFYPDASSNRGKVVGDVLLAQADRMLYEAKASGRNRVVSAGAAEVLAVAAGW